MRKQKFNKCSVLRWKQFSRKGYSLFACLSKEVVIGTLSVATLQSAKADNISEKSAVATDSLGHQEVKLDEVVVTGSRAPLTSLQSAKIVSVITSDDIHRAAAESINDVLKLATGVDVRQRGGFGVQTDISINGGTFDQITILLNGVNISSPQTGHNAADFPVSINDIERIEILEGASARVFGSSAFSGAINIVTRSGHANNVQVNAEGGSFGTFGGGASVDAGKGEWHNHASGGYYQSDGGTANSDFRKRNAYYQGDWASRYLNLNWQAGMVSKDYGANTFYSAKFNNQYEETRRYIASLSGEVHGLPSDLTITPMLYWHRDYDHFQLIRGSEGAAKGENYHKMDVYGASVNACISWILGKTAVGADIRKEKIYSTAYGEALDENQWKDISGSDRMYDHKGERTNTSVFVEHNVILNKFTLSAGLLANKNTGLDSDFRFYPGIDVSYRPSDNWKIYASWNKALRMPTYTDLYTSNVAQQGDKSLKPEKNSTFKTGVRYRRLGFETVLSAFYSNGTDMIDWVYENASSTKYHAMNIGKLDNMGASLDATLNMDELVSNSFITQIKAGYAYIHQKHKTDEDIYKSLYALEYLRHKFTFSIAHRIFSHLSADWSLRWQERMNGYKPYTKIDCKLMWDGGNYDLYLKADNLTAHRYYDLGAVKQPGLWIMAGGSIKINW
jgi:vitamin B12 transporter